MQTDQFVSIKDLEEIMAEAMDYGYKHQGEGKVADYIPALAKADPKELGMSILTLDGTFYNKGAWDHLFTIQSISKAMLLSFALKELGADVVFRRVGVEPTGDSFNSIVKLETDKDHPLNPFINAGAIATVGLMVENGMSFEDFLAFMPKLIGREDLQIDEEVYRSEKSTGDRNRSLAYFLKSDGTIRADVSETLDFYFRMCSILVNCKDLAYFGALLANDGVDLFTKESVLDPYNTSLVKTLMVTCGMYDSSGEFAIKVGMPAKSGVGGGICALAQGKLGSGIYSPELDEKGNSLVGIKTMEYLSWALDLHFFKGKS